MADYTTFSYQALASSLQDPSLIAAVQLSAKGTSQQFYLATGKQDARRSEEDFDQVEPLKELAKFGIHPWSDNNYRRIQDGTLCLDYLRIRNVNPSLPHKSTYLCLAFDRTGVRHAWHVGDLEATEARLEELTAMAATGRGGPDFDAKYAELSKWCIGQFIAPALKDAKGVKKLMVCPDGHLNFLPFDGLLREDGRLLADAYEVVLVPSMRMLFEGEGRDVEEDGGKRRALVLGNPSFDSQSPLGRLDTTLAKRSVSRSDIDFRPLPGTAQEIRDLNEALVGKGWQVESLSGEGAGEAQLFARCKGPDLFHLASHAYYMPDFEPGKLMPGKRKLGGDFSSGIAVAGANTTIKAWGEGKVPDSAQDGLITPEELARLDLKGCGLVVLSACETARGKVLDGEGVQGLALGAAVAGARNLVTTLWPVEDAATAELMKGFYRLYLSGMAPSPALRQVKREHFAKWRSELGLPAALSRTAGFVCTTVEPFSAR